MVQDMHNPEFYFEQFEVFNTVTNVTKSKSGKYRDTAHILVSNQKQFQLENQNIIYLFLIRLSTSY